MDGSRREFLQGSGVLAGASALRFGIPGLAVLSQAACSARDAGAAFETLSAGEARELDAITARILPTTDTPGARDAGVIWFIDKSLGGFLAPRKDVLLGGLADFQAPVAAAFPGATQFSDLDEADQDRHLRTQDTTPFFGFVRFMTLAGTFGMASYGGNRDGASWQLLGLDPHQHAFLPPFGHYDAAAATGDNHGG